jgi:hypothetical protein
MVIRGATALTNLGRLSSRRWRIMVIVKIKVTLLNKNYLDPIYEYNNDYANVDNGMIEPVACSKFVDINW